MAADPRCRGGTLAPASTRATERGALALLNAGALTGTLLVSALAGTPRAPRLRALSVGARRTEIVLDPNGGARIVTTTAAGALCAPARYESRQRLTLRRALGAVDEGVFGDLESYRRDVAVAASIIPSASAL
ncbi:hypothetical protein [Microbacterium sp.]|uniref:hypothetical protein n=1 Tax=Microbacterium sp. TaxID=51671 RepID=UPI0039E2B6D3